jgi:hypothetical protein
MLRIGTSLPLRLMLLVSVASSSAILVAGIAAVRGTLKSDAVWLIIAFLMCCATGIGMIVFDWVGSGIPSSEGGLTGLMHVAFGFLVRMGLPLLTCAMVAMQLGEATARTFACYLLLLYPLVLFTETLLTVWRRRASELTSDGFGGQPHRGNRLGVGVDG